jgi:hypothetical protein
MMLYGWREREVVLRFFQKVTGLRMNHNFIRPGGVAADLPADWRDDVMSILDMLPDRLGEYDVLMTNQPIWRERLQGVGVITQAEAIALGATVVEKHITIRRADGGADAAFSMEPSEFAALVREGTYASQSLGKSEWKIQSSEQESRRLRRSLYVVKNVQAGEIVSRENVRSIRPSGGCPPKLLDGLIGKKFNKNESIGTPMSEDLVK